MKVPLASKSHPSLRITTTTSLPVPETDVETHGWPALLQTQHMHHSQPDIQTSLSPKLVTRKHLEPIVKQDGRSQTEKTVSQSNPQSHTTQYPVSRPYQQPPSPFHPQAQTTRPLQPKPKAESISFSSTTQPKIKQKPNSKSIAYPHSENQPELQTKQAFLDMHDMLLHTSTQSQLRIQPQEPQVTILPKHTTTKLQSTTTPQLNTQPLEEPQVQHKPPFQPKHFTEPQPGTKSTSTPKLKIQPLEEPRVQHEPTFQPKHFREPQPGTKFATKRPHFFQTQSPELHTKKLDEYQPQTEKHSFFIARFSPKPKINQTPTPRSTFKMEIEARTQPQPEITVLPKHHNDQKSKPTFRPSTRSKSERQPKPTIHSHARQLPRPGSKPKNSKKSKLHSTSRPETLTKRQLQPQPTVKSKSLRTQPKTISFSENIPTKKSKPKTSPQTISPTKKIKTNSRLSFQPITKNEYRARLKPTFSPRLIRPTEPLSKQTQFYQHLPLNDSKSENQQTFQPKGEQQQQSILKGGPILLKVAEPQPKSLNLSQLQLQPTMTSESPIKQNSKVTPLPKIQNERNPQHPDNFQTIYHKEQPHTLQTKQMPTTSQTVLQIQSQPKPKTYPPSQGETHPQPQTESHTHSLPEHSQSQPLSQAESMNESLPLSQTTSSSLDEPHLHTVRTTAPLKTQPEPRLKTTPKSKLRDEPPPHIQSAAWSPSQFISTAQPIFQTKSGPKTSAILDPKPLNKPRSQLDINPKLQTTQSSTRKPPSPNKHISPDVINEPPQPEPIFEPRLLNNLHFQPTIPSKPQIRQQPKSISQPILETDFKNEAQLEPTPFANHQTDEQPLHKPKFQGKPSEMAHNQGTTLPTFQVQTQTQPNRNIQSSHPTPKLQHLTKNPQSFQHIPPNNPNDPHLPSPTPQAIPVTHLQSHNYPNTYHKLEPQTAFTTLTGLVQQQKHDIKHQVHPQTQQSPVETKTEHPTALTHSQTPHPTIKYMRQTQQTVLKTSVRSQQNDTTQIKPEQENNPKPHKTPKKEPKTESPVPLIKHTTQTKPKGQQKSKSQPKEKTQHEQKVDKTQKEPKPNERPKPPTKRQQKPKSNGEKQQPKSKLWTKKQTATEIYIETKCTAKPIYQLQPLLSTHSPLEPLSKSYPGPRPKQVPQPRVPIQPVNWTLSEPTKPTPMQAVPTGKQIFYLTLHQNCKQPPPPKKKIFL